MSNYDPSQYTVEEVNAYLAEHPDERDAVLAAEAQGKNRSTIAQWAEGTPQPPLEGGTPEAPLAEEAVDLDAGHPPGEYPETGIFGYVSEEGGVQAGREASQPEA